MNKKRVQCHGECSGSVAVEALITVPFFLLGILIFLWIGFVMNAKTSFISSLYKGVRLAITRGDLDRARTSLIAPLVDWHDSAGPVPENLLKSADISWPVADTHYTNEVISVFHGTTPDLQHMPVSYISTLTYFYEGLKQAIGPSVRYPCNPDTPGSAGDGCVSCVFLNPDDRSTTPSAAPPPQDAIGLRCRYRPAVFVLSPAADLLRIITGAESVSMPVFQSQLFLIAPGVDPEIESEEII